MSLHPTHENMAKGIWVRRLPAGAQPTSVADVVQEARRLSLQPEPNCCPLSWVGWRYTNEIKPNLNGVPFERDIEIECLALTATSGTELWGRSAGSELARVGMPVKLTQWKRLSEEQEGWVRHPGLAP